MLRHALFRNDMLCCPALFRHAILCSVLLVDGAGGGTIGDTRGTWGSGGRGMQGGRAGRSVLKI